MIKAYAKSDIGKVREINQDYYYISNSLDEVQLYMLADGMGGYKGGEIASKLAVLSAKSYIENNFKDVPKPENLEEMVITAEKIASGFKQVRVDLYDINNKIYFGEMTFTSQGGRMSYYTQEFQEKMGGLIDLKK